MRSTCILNAALGLTLAAACGSDDSADGGGTDTGASDDGGSDGADDGGTDDGGTDEGGSDDGGDDGSDGGDDGGDDGEAYVLLNPNNSRTTYLIDMDGQVVHTWEDLTPGGYSVYLLENGNLLRPAMAAGAQLHGGAEAGLVQEIDWDANVVWEFEYNSATYLTHHDIEPMPNGNVLLIAWEVIGDADAEAAGREDGEFWPDHLIEVAPTGASGGDIVWEWHAWDHLIQDVDPQKPGYGTISDHPELLDINLGGSGGPPGPGPGGGGDWLHINGVSYNPELDQIVMSSHFMNEIYVVDHSTTTEEAAGHTGGNSGMGGDIVYRWGNPANYGAPGGAQFAVVHCSVWIPEGHPGAGNILVFNNGTSSGQSTVVELVPPVDASGHYELTPGEAYGPAGPVWTYTAPGFFSEHLGGNQRLPNGDTLVAESTSGRVFKVTPDGEVVFEISAPGDEIARALQYAGSYPGLAELGR